MRCRDTFRTAGDAASSVDFDGAEEAFSLLPEQDTKKKISETERSKRPAEIMFCTPMTKRKIGPPATLCNRKELMAPFNAKPDEMAVMNKVAAKIKELGMYTFVRWGYIFIAPPLTITKEEVEEGLAVISEALKITGQRAVVGHGHHAGDERPAHP